MKRFLKWFGVALALILTFLGLWALVIEPNRLVVNQYRVKVQNWSPKLNNFRIVAISDVHGGSNFIDEAKIHSIVEKANAQNPDMIVLLGDYVSQSLTDHQKLELPLKTIVENLQGLKAANGVYVIIGNHDGKYDKKAVRREFESIGYQVLENEAVQIEKNGEKLRIVGLPDSLSWDIADSQLPTAQEGLAKLGNTEGKVIVLTHNPDDVLTVTGSALISPDLVLLLAGHTHGGQVRLPMIGAPITPSDYGQKYAAGHIRDKGIDMFVTTGIGTSIFPVRFGVPPEIAVLNIEAE